MVAGLLLTSRTLLEFLYRFSFFRGVANSRSRANTRAKTVMNDFRRASIDAESAARPVDFLILFMTVISRPRAAARVPQPLTRMHYGFTSATARKNARCHFCL